MVLDFTLLTEKQIWGDKDGNGQLDVMKEYGTKVAPTDLAVILGGQVSGTYYNRTSEGETTCVSWSASPEKGAADVQCIDFGGGKGSWEWPNYRYIPVRPALPPSETEKLTSTNRKTGVNGVDIIEYGEYPQTVADEETCKKLEKLHESSSLHPTGKNYIFDSVDPTESRASFEAISYPEYELDGKKYIRVPGRPYSESSRLSTKELIMEGEPYWVKVQPIEWLMDKSGWMVSKKCLFAGIQFDTETGYRGDFSKTFMKLYFDAYFATEIEPSELIAEKREKVIKGLNEKLSEISDLEKVKETITPARTPERTDILARITRVRKAKSLLSKAAQKAQKEGDKKTLEEIIEMAKPYAAREAVVLDKFHQRQAERRAQKGRE